LLLSASLDFTPFPDIYLVSTYKSLLFNNNFIIKKLFFVVFANSIVQIYHMVF